MAVDTSVVDRKHMLYARLGDGSSIPCVIGRVFMMSCPVCMGPLHRHRGCPQP